MKLSDAIEYSYIKTIRDKKNIYFIIILALCLFVLLASLFFRIVYFDLVDDSIENSKNSRKIPVLSAEASKILEDKNYDLGYDKLLELEHTVDIYDSRYDSFYTSSNDLKDEKHDGSITFVYGSEALQPKYINGDKFKNSDTGVAICPKKFNPDASDLAIRNEDIEFFNGDDLIGTTFKVETQRYKRTDAGFVEDGMYKKEYKIIGTYDASETRDEFNACYISPKDIKEIKDATDTNNYDYAVTNQYLIVDKYKNKEKIIKKIESMGFSVQIMSYSADDFYNMIKLVCLLIVFIAIITIIFLASLYIKKQNIKNKGDIAIMKSYGYKKKDIRRFSLCSLSCLMFISFVAGIILFLVVLTILKIVFNNFLLVNHIHLGFYISHYAIALLILVIITIITNFYTINKLSKKQTLSIIKE